ncbi:MAG: biosynthetic-type acetolactate synthase large subunit [Spirochaeta sp.]|nr:biosynthetic-type acetolactate synthase large subunit [Spirochaeta sp.]
MKKNKISGARGIIKSLENQGVEVLFGYPGGATLPIYDELARSSIRHILTRHEQGAAHMADGYARATGKVGVCMATSGPGATNLVTGLANAYMDSSPVVAITGQVPRAMIGNDAFQEVDITGITLPITKHNYLIQQADFLPASIEEAFYLASSGRKGPVLIDIPKDVQLEEFSFKDTKRQPLEGYKPTVKGHPGQVKRAISLIKNAKRPLIITGGGISLADADEELRLLSEKGDIPVVYTLMGKAAFPNFHKNCFGLIGYHGRVEANTAIQRSDLIIAAGTRFGDRSTGPLSTFATQAKIIHIDIDPAEISKNVAADLPIVGDAKNIIGQLADLLPPDNHSEWHNFLKKVAQDHPLKGKMEGVTIPNILRILFEISHDPLIVTDVGKHQIFTAHYFPIQKSRSFITSGGLGTMGFGVPAAIGAKTGRPDRKVITISGDGSFMMNCQEIATAVEENMPIIVMIMNDYCLGMINQLQDIFYGKRYSACNLGKAVNYSKLAESMGAQGMRVTEEKDIVAAMEKALSADRVSVIDFVLDDTANVYPMVTGSSLLEYVE